MTNITEPETAKLISEAASEFLGNLTALMSKVGMHADARADLYCYETLRSTLEHDEERQSLDGLIRLRRRTAALLASPEASCAVLDAAAPLMPILEDFARVPEIVFEDRPAEHLDIVNQLLFAYDALEDACTLTGYATPDWKKNPAVTPMRPVEGRLNPVPQAAGNTAAGYLPRFAGLYANAFTEVIAEFISHVWQDEEETFLERIRAVLAEADEGPLTRGAARRTAERLKEILPCEGACHTALLAFECLRPGLAVFRDAGIRLDDEALAVNVETALELLEILTTAVTAAGYAVPSWERDPSKSPKPACLPERIEMLAPAEEAAE